RRMAAMIRYRCPQCQSPLRSRDEDAGYETDCPRCETPFVVPDGRSAAPTRQPLLLLAALTSPVIPVGAVVIFFLGAPWEGREVLGGIGLACGLGGLGAVVGLCGVARNGVVATVPASVVGLVLNAVVGSLALLLWALSGLPRC